MHSADAVAGHLEQYWSHAALKCSSVMSALVIDLSAQSAYLSIGTGMACAEFYIACKLRRFVLARAAGSKQSTRLQAS